MKAQVSHVQQVHAVHDAPFNHLGGLSRPPPSATACFQGVSDLSDAASPSPHERLSEKGNGGLAGKGGGAAQEAKDRSCPRARSARASSHPQASSGWEGTMEGGQVDGE